MVKRESAELQMQNQNISLALPPLLATSLNTTKTPGKDYSICISPTFANSTFLVTFVLHTRYILRFFNITSIGIRRSRVVSLVPGPGTHH